MKQQIEPLIQFRPQNKQNQLQNCHSSANSQPWMTDHTRNIANPIVRFHNEIIDFSIFMQASSVQHNRKLALFNAIQQSIKDIDPKSSIFAPFLVNNLYLKHTELQIYVINSKQRFSNESNSSEVQYWQSECTGICQALSQKLDLKLYSLSTQYNRNQCKFMCEYYYLQNLDNNQTDKMLDANLQKMVNKQSINKQMKIDVWIHFVVQPFRSFISQIDLCINNNIQIRYLFSILDCLVRQHNWHTSIQKLFLFGMCSYFAYQRRKQRPRTLTQNLIKFFQLFSIGYMQERDRKIIYREGNSYNCITNSQRGLNFEIFEGINLASSKKVRDLVKIFQNKFRVLGNLYFAPQSSILAYIINSELQGQNI